MTTIAFSVPIEPGKTEQWRSFCQELTGGRAADFSSMNKRMGLTRHAAWLQSTPMGDVAVVVHEGPGAESFLGKLAVSEQPFETWMRKTLESIHPMDFDDPPPPPEAGMDWKG